MPKPSRSFPEEIPDFSLVPKDRPVIFSLRKQESIPCTIKDHYESWLKELFKIRNPRGTDTDMDSFIKARNHPQNGLWVYYPWIKEAHHIPEKEEFAEIFFSRNFPIISQNTQKRLADIRVGVAGLSVGSNIVYALAQTGITKFNLADPDSISPSNLQRLARADGCSIGKNKTEHTSEQLYQLNPFVEIKAFRQGITPKTLPEFVNECDIIIEEVDSPLIKYELRRYIHSAAGQGKILLMASDIGTRPTFDIERHTDQLFHGRISEEEIQAFLSGPQETHAKLALFTKIIGEENMADGLKKNFLNIIQAKQNFLTQVGLTATAAAGQIAATVLLIAEGHADTLPETFHLDLQPTLPLNKGNTLAKEFHIAFTPAQSPPSITTVRMNEGIRHSTATIGKYTIVTSESPTHALTYHDRLNIRYARQSYQKWGDITGTEIIHDRFDDLFLPGFETTHYRTTFSIDSRETASYHMRATFFSRKILQNPRKYLLAPDDIKIWHLLHTKTGKIVSFKDALETYMEKTGKQTITVLSRFCSPPNIPKPPETIAIAWAMMQMLITDAYHNPGVIISTHTISMPKKLCGITIENKTIMPNFTRTNQLLEPSTDWQAILDDTNTTVQDLRRRFPKFWNHAFSATLLPEMWRKSNYAVLLAAAEKYR